MQALLAAGASPSATDASFLDMKTPLHKAAGQGHRGICVALLDAGADPNACDAAGNSVLDVLSLASPPVCKHDGGGRDIESSGNNPRGAGVGNETCSVVVLSKGEKSDWNGVRSALQRHGGRYQRSNARDSETSYRNDTPRTDNGSEEGSNRDIFSSVGGKNGNTGGCESIDATLISRFGGTATEENFDIARPTLASACVSSSSGSKGEDGRLGTVDRADSAGNVTPLAAQSGEQHRHSGTTTVRNPLFIDSSRSEGGGEEAGMPCGECRFPKVVMVRASCCGSLVCKSCARDMSARRHCCRKCRSTVDGKA